MSESIPFKANVSHFVHVSASQLEQSNLQAFPTLHSPDYTANRGELQKRALIKNI